MGNSICGIDDIYGEDDNPIHRNQQIERIEIERIRNRNRRRFGPNGGYQRRLGVMVEAMRIEVENSMRKRYEDNHTFTGKKIGGEKMNIDDLMESQPEAWRFIESITQKCGDLTIFKNRALTGVKVLILENDYGIFCKDFSCRTLSNSLVKLHINLEKYRDRETIGGRKDINHIFQSNVFCSLKSLRINSKVGEKDTQDIIGKDWNPMMKLRVLSIRSPMISDSLFVQNRRVVFPKLRVLILDGMFNHWNGMESETCKTFLGTGWNEKNFHCVEKLVIRNMAYFQGYVLRQIKLPKLKRITIWHCPKVQKEELEKHFE